MRSLRAILLELIMARSVLDQLVRQQLILRYRRTMLGYLWTLINPLMMMTITALVFSTLFKIEIKTFAIFLFSGMVPWNFFNTIIVQSSSTFISNEGLIKKIYLPKMIFPLSIAVSILVDSVLALFALFVVLFVIGWTPSWELLFLPFAYILLLFFTLGIALLASVITAFYRDVQHVIVIAIQALFFLTPIIYDKTSLMDGGILKTLVSLNPVTPYIALFRSPICYGQLPDIMVVVHCLILSTVSMAAALCFFMQQEKKIVFRL